MPKRILSVSYDLALLQTREMLLQAAGYEVVSIEGFQSMLDLAQSKNAPEFDLVILGHSIAHRDKEALIKLVRERWKAPVLALLRAGESSDVGADDACDPFHVQNFMRKVKQTLESGPPSARPAMRRT